MNKKRFFILFFVTVLISLTVFCVYTGKLIKDARVNTAHIDTTHKIISNPSDSNFVFFLDSAMQSAESLSQKLSGRKISILITGVDARLGSTSVHADANHLLNFWLDSGKIEILSIPRGTYVDLGYDDSCNINYLANVRSLRGREKYQKAVKEILNIDTINYFVEFGFSQAIGLMELLGFKENSVQMLRVLRSRKSFGIGDYQRAYNQGQFIRQMILTQFAKSDGFLGDIALRAGLLLVDHNLTFEKVKEIISIYKARKFPKTSNDVIIRLVPKFNAALADFNFTSKKETDSLYRRIASIASGDSEVTDSKVYDNKSISDKIFFRLRSLIKNASRDTLKNPQMAIKTLDMPFRQRTWYQITEQKLRDSVRNDVFKILIASYQKQNRSDMVNYLKQIYNSEVRKK